MSGFGTRLTAAVQAVRLGRLTALLLAALAAGLLSDWVRSERVFFPRRLPEFTIVPSGQ